MDGRHLLLVSMDTNGLSASWERLGHFVFSFHEQYSTLHIAVRIMLGERELELRANCLTVPCPHVVGTQAFGFYDSRDSVRYAQERANTEVQKWYEILDGNAERTKLQGRLMRQLGCWRIKR
jgi:hypothetical protein